MNLLSCLKCGNTEFQEVIQLFERKRMVATVHVHPDGSVEESGGRKETDEVRRETVSFVCIKCSSEYVFQNGYLMCNSH